MKKKTLTDSLIIGAALFSALFGAGNMIFPPYLGLESGQAWFWGFVGFYIADVGLAVLAIAAIVNKDSFKALASPIGDSARTVLTLAVVICLGPLISIPRTCATTFELAVLPLFPKLYPLAFSLIFFLLTFLLALNESKVIDVVGKILTPALVAGLLFLIIKGVLYPIADTVENVSTPSPIGSGIMAGYQSMDILGMAVLDTLIIGNAISRGHRDRASKRAVILGACTVAAVGLFVIYLGLTYLGSTASALFPSSISRTELLTGIVSILLPGKWGTLLFGTVAGLACLTTSVALTGASAKYFEDLLRHRLKYRQLVAVICIIGCVLSVLGVEKIVAFASPVLTVIYPPILVLIILSFFHSFVTPMSYKLAVAGGVVYGIAEAIGDQGIKIALLDVLPLSQMDLGWLLPCTFLAIVGIKYRHFAEKK